MTPIAQLPSMASISCEVCPLLPQKDPASGGVNVKTPDLLQGPLSPLHLRVLSGQKETDLNAFQSSVQPSQISTMGPWWELSIPSPAAGHTN